MTSKAPPAADTKTSIDRSRDLEDILGSWVGVVNYIKPKKISVASYLQEGYPVSLTSDTITIGFPKEHQFHKDVLDSLDNRRLIEEAIKSTLNMELKVVLVTTEPANTKRTGMNGYIETGSEEEPLQSGQGAGEDSDPIVKAALEMFGGEIANRNSKKR